MVPHPDDIIIDVHDNSFRFIGPITDEDKAAWMRKAKRRDDVRKLLAESEAELETTEDEERRSSLSETIASITPKLQKIVDAIGE